MNIIIKIKLYKMMLNLRLKKKTKNIFNKKENITIDTAQANIEVPNTILSINLKHLDFIDRLENGLNRKQAQNAVLMQELNAIKRQVQLNTLSHLHNKVAS